MANINVSLLMVGAALVLLSLASIASTGPTQDGSANYLDVETPNFFNYNSPLRQPGSLRSRPYYDFLSTLYRRDTTKTDLFRPYNGRVRRDVAAVPVVAAAPVATVVEEPRNKRAIIFRPLFVYKQQQVRKQEIAERKRKRKRT